MFPGGTIYSQPPIQGLNSMQEGGDKKPTGQRTWFRWAALAVALILLGMALRYGYIRVKG